ncbi:prenyltransferase/squalene oxidase repeat-containing protein [Planctomicrobium sp. SH527]|uniref:prenyltransferase/squalene oxidase repeat-containing protein n=1 Tax=Planctomicrobium sp. SH527 TaxID=3448123 RepID=UPI003F5C8719
MQELPYLVRLGNRLNQGLRGFSDQRRDTHAQFLLQFQQADGGFRGRDGDSDLYYTSFAIRALWMLERLTPATVTSVGEFLKGLWSAELNTLDQMNWLSTALALEVAGGSSPVANIEELRSLVAQKMEATRTSDGGYAKATEGATGSTYQGFLVLLTYQLLDLKLPRPNALIQFLYDRQREDGGFVEIAPMRRSGTNPTAAAAAILQELNVLDRETRNDIEAFLRDVKCQDEAGFTANTRIPFADSLSTFTAVLTTQNLQLRHAYHRDDLIHWVTSQLEFPTGGFRAATWDDQADVEYSFYGLGLLALLDSNNGAGTPELDTTGKGDS